MRSEVVRSRPNPPPIEHVNLELTPREADVLRVFAAASCEPAVRRYLGNRAPSYSESLLVMSGVRPESLQDPNQIVTVVEVTNLLAKLFSALGELKGLSSLPEAD